LSSHTRFGDSLAELIRHLCSSFCLC
jgi:hypothetical protein